MDHCFKETTFLAYNYSIANVATFPWVPGYQFRRVKIAKFPKIPCWLETSEERLVAKQGIKVPTKAISKIKPFTK